MIEKTTLRVSVNAAQSDSPSSRAALAQAADILRDGGTVAFPTETVYGLGAIALSADAVARIFEAKARPVWDPLIVHISDDLMLATVARDVSAAAKELIDAFWPGPLTLLLPRTELVPDVVTAGRELVGVRMPRHPVAHALIATADMPIAAPSANRFGRISPTTAAHVLEDLDGRIDCVIDGGPTGLGVESTVVDASSSKIVCYRPGAITQEQIEAIVGPITMFAARETSDPDEGLPSPGIGMRHYAPRARLMLMEGNGAALQQKLARSAAELSGAGERVGVMLPSGWRPPTAEAVIFPWGDWTNGHELAQRLFAGLRHLDSAGVSVIVCPLPEPRGICVAVRDRLLKAARAS